MKIYANQLESQLRDKLAPIYIINSDEPLLLNEACDLIRNAAKKRGFDEKVIFNVDKAFDWKNLLIAASTQSLFANKKLIELRLSSGKPGAKGSEILRQYAANSPEDTILLIITNKLETATQNSVWFKQLNKIAVFAPIWPPTIEQLPQWIKQRLIKSGVNTSYDATQLLAEYSEGNLLAAAQEIEKLRLLYGKNNITTQQVITAITDNARFSIFDLVDSAIAEETAKAIRILHTLKQEKTEPTIILWALTRELRSLIKMAQQKKQGISIDQILQNNRVWKKRIPIIKHALLKNSLATFTKKLQKCAKIDRIIKGAQQGNCWDEFEEFLQPLTNHHF